MFVKIYFFFFLTTFYLLLTTTQVFSLSFPKPKGYVNDFAQLYSPEFVQSLESDLLSYDQNTGNQIAVVTLSSLEGEQIDDYATRLFEAWSIGKKGKDTGILLLISRDDRQMRIEVGYGLEPLITDGRAGEIIRTIITPRFRSGEYEAGTKDAVTRIQFFLSGGQEIQDTSMISSHMSDIPVIPLLVFGYGFMTYVGSFLGRSKEIWPGGVIGSAIGLLGGYFFFSFFWWILISVLMGLGGLLLDYVLSKNYHYRSDHGLPTGFWHSGGGFSSGGGSFGGGGFGGFGGGRSGGGGASGRW